MAAKASSPWPVPRRVASPSSPAWATPAWTAVDHIVGAEALHGAIQAYLGGGSAEQPLVSPLFADLTGLPPILVQCGSHEVPLDDSTSLAAPLASADVDVALEITPGASHVLQARGPELPEASAALRSPGRFLRRHLD